MQPPAMLATSALHLSGHRHRQITCHPGTSLGVGRGENHLAPNQGCTGGWSICSHLNEVMRSWVRAAECSQAFSWSKKCLIVHFLSPFIEHPNPFPNHSITHLIVTIHLTDLVMNLTWLHIPSIWKTNYRPYFTVSGPFNCLKRV